MEIKQYQAAVEAVLFASGEPIAASRLAEVLELDEETTVRLADDLMQEVNTRSGGLLIVRLGKYPDVHQKQLRGLYPQGAGYPPEHTPSQAAMETLAIVAYNQPVTRAFIDQVRGGGLRRGGAGAGRQESGGGKGKAGTARPSAAVRHHAGFPPLLWSLFAGRTAASAAEGRERYAGDHARRGDRGQRRHSGIGFVCRIPGEPGQRRKRGMRAAL